MCVLSSVIIDLWHFIVHRENIIHIACIGKYLQMYKVLISDKYIAA